MKTWKTINGNEITKVLGGRSNVYLISGNGKHILVDTSPEGWWKKLSRRLKSLNIKSIDYLILTHSHYDHAANAEKIKREFNAKIIIHETEAPCLEKGENAITDGTNRLTAFFVRALQNTFLSKIRYNPCKPDILTGDSFNLSEKGIVALVIHTPGHSPGSLSIIIDNEIALVGDTMFGVFSGSVLPPFALDTDEMIRSWGRLLGTGCRIFLPSHGTEDSRALLAAEYKRRSNR